MATRISVTVKGPIGLDDPDRMLGELEKATDLSWQLRVVDQGKVLFPGIAEIVLTAVISKGVEISTEAVVNAVKDRVKRWRSERLDPLDATVAAESAPDATDGPAADGAGD